MGPIIYCAVFRLAGLGNNCQKGIVAKFMDGVETDSTWKCDTFNWNTISGPAGIVWRYYGYNDSYWLPAEVFPPGYVEEFVWNEMVFPICTSTTEVDMPCPANYIWSQGSTGPFFCRKVIYWLDNVRPEGQYCNCCLQSDKQCNYFVEKNPVLLKFHKVMHDSAKMPILKEAVSFTLRTLIQKTGIASIKLYQF